MRFVRAFGRVGHSPVDRPGCSLAALCRTGHRTELTDQYLLHRIDPGIGHYYTYAPSVIQMSPTTRDVFDCENYKSNVVHDNVYLSVGHLVNGLWEYGPLKSVFGPADDPSPHGYFSVHACEPEVIGGNFHFGGQPYKWAPFSPPSPSPATRATSWVSPLPTIRPGPGSPT